MIYRTLFDYTTADGRAASSGGLLSPATIAASHAEACEAALSLQGPQVRKTWRRAQVVAEHAPSAFGRVPTYGPVETFTP